MLSNTYSPSSTHIDGHVRTCAYTHISRERQSLVHIGIGYDVRNTNKSGPFGSYNYNNRNAHHVTKMQIGGMKTNHKDVCVRDDIMHSG